MSEGNGVAGSPLSIRVGDRLIVTSLERLASAWHDAIPRIMSRSAAAVAAASTETLTAPVN